MTAATDRDALAAKVRKLAKMTVENGCSENEAAFAFKRIAEIMAAHALTQDELSLKEDAAKCVRDEFIYFGQEVGDWGLLQASIARLFACKHWYAKVRLEELEGLDISHPVRPFVFYGMPYDVVACISTMRICHSAVATAADKERRKQQDFAAGMIARLILRINDLKPKFTTGTGLIVLKDQLVTEAFAKEGIRLRSVYTGNNGTRPIDKQAYAKGFAAGAHVNIGGGRSATPAPAQPRQRGPSEGPHGSALEGRLVK